MTETALFLRASEKGSGCFYNLPGSLPEHIEYSQQAASETTLIMLRSGPGLLVASTFVTCPSYEASMAECISADVCTSIRGTYEASENRSTNTEAAPEFSTYILPIM